MESESDLMASSQIYCEEHGVTSYCIICQHLCAERGLQYYSQYVAADDYPAHSWCNHCDALLQEDEGWSDRGDEFAGWKLLCAGCHAQVLKGHDFVCYVQGSDA